MKELRTEFDGIGEVRNFKFKLMHESKTAFMYQKDYQGFISYEVFIRRENEYYGTVYYPIPVHLESGHGITGITVKH
jgi:hypothetical protein